ncbi:MAG: hypothetical protein KAS17_04300 [Victivallaceae bacterium]|nr:hypothetical protein [Victivallaceae bacterium]
MKKIRNLYPYTLVEVLCVIFFLILISGFAFKYYYHFQYSYRSSIDNSIRMRRVMTISERWKKVFEGTFIQAPVIENGKIIFNKNDYAALVENQIIIHRRKKTYSLRLPKNTSAAFAIENDPHGSCLIILNLNWKYSHSSNRNAPGKTHTVRIISAVTVEHGDKSHE